ncbi:MAG TPA: DUF2390 domain-containing protein [Coxiellaceae bacterium]|nr:MAG: hypothetical protein A3E81_04600 [Gammaproteobacteria bacterium RIFCSPHIGHO2_12_FULL_36_30]HLB55965.1 DUF2390 domain-containing protein [Coxiellaceae bacterium]
MDDCPFTRFASVLLEKTDLNQAIYHLQHDSGFNINIILYLLWLAKARYGRLTKRHVNMLQTQITVWHQRVIAELKYTHALLVDQKDVVALQIKQELQAEIIRAHIIEQHMLYEIKLKRHLLRRSSKQQLADACASVLHYCELKNDLLVDDDQIAFTQLFSAVFDETSQTEIEKNILNSFDQLKIEQPAQLMWREF